MGLDSYINTYGAACKARFGQKVKKLTIDAKFTCPNRDGTLGRGGCTFCNVSSFSHEAGTDLGISEQISQGKFRQRDRQAKGLGNNKDAANDKYIAYFQAYTSTYDEYALLKARYDEAIKDEHIVGLAVGTRPDCVPDAVIELLADYQDKGLEVWLELGLQTANEQTLKRINRGHGWQEYADTVARARRAGIKVCTHLILGLPGETHQDYMQTLTQVLELGIDGLKIHPLHIVEGSTMAKAWRSDKLTIMALEDYAFSVGEMIRATPKHIIYHRVAAYAQRPMLLAPDWCSRRWDAMVAIEDNLREFGGQGQALRSD
ncbi:TIGR01212 family radical SAM protein [Shewanella sp. SNU WT4]|uniref:TIGR01212 family radical SAM protein n=1 Tax=Shewanella sp. SNU WT4 TaxID=2590015 RepID=UPI001129F26B|nr:TIGR01212 family radical SAM protein [Shewanella sp. SNU WT4]QDF66294.1 TIGR01212 family radical SAM protein [Shewanella sp. SNU WT4]